MPPSLPRDPFAAAAGRADPYGVTAARIVPTALRLVPAPPLPEPVEQDDIEPDTAVAADSLPADAEVAEERDPDRPFRPLSRELDHRHALPEVRAPKHDYLTPRYSRLAQSAVTFGPVGRVVLTIVLLAIPAFLLWVSLAWILFDGIYLFFVVPALRDVWQPVRVAAPLPDAEPADDRSLSGR